MILPRNPHRNEKPTTRYPIFSPKIPGFFLGLDPWLVAGDDIDDSFDGTIVDVYCARAHPGAAALQSLFLRYKWGLESECPIDHVYVMIVTQWNLHTVSAKKMCGFC